VTWHRAPSTGGSSAGRRTKWRLRSPEPRLGGGFAIPEPALQALNVSVGTGVLLFLYFLLGSFLYASVFAIVGAAVTSERSA
jgi:hypothetical protein